MSELVFSVKNTQRNTPSKITQILGDTGVDNNYILIYNIILFYYATYTFDTFFYAIMQ
jgi:hypothetical protein